MRAGPDTDAVITTVAHSIAAPRTAALLAMSMTKLDPTVFLEESSGRMMAPRQPRPPKNPKQ